MHWSLYLAIMFVQNTLHRYSISKLTRKVPRIALIDALSAFIISNVTRLRFIIYKSVLSAITQVSFYSGILMIAAKMGVITFDSLNKVIVYVWKYRRKIILSRTAVSEWWRIWFHAIINSSTPYFKQAARQTWAQKSSAVWASYEAILQWHFSAQRISNVVTDPVCLGQ